MPVSPYSGQIYSGYAVGRPYAGTLSSNYYTASNSTLGVGLSNEKKPFVKATSPGKTPFLAGNTAALTKNFLNSKGGELNNNKNKCLNSATDEKEQKYDTTSLRSEIDDKKPKPIDTSKINVSEKRNLYSNPSSSGTEEDKLITRNRQVVRLTIKRDKDKDKKCLPENSVKTIAQKLFEKYTLPEKIKEDPLAHVPKNRLPLHTTAEKHEPRKVVDKPPNLPIPPATKASTPKGGSTLTEDDGNEGDDELSADESEGDNDAATKCFARATMDTTINKELEDPEAVKDAIVAAILHPAVDIESDEEIKQLVNSGSNEDSRSNSKKRRKSKVDPQLLAKRRTSDAEIGGEMIIDKLKRYVKHQVSIKNASRRASQDIDFEALANNDSCSTVGEKINPLSFYDQIISNIERKDKYFPYASTDKEPSDDVSSEKAEKTSMTGEEESQNGEYKSETSTTPEMSSLLNETKNTIKSNSEQTLNKSFEPVYQTALGGDPARLKISSKGSDLVSGDRSTITHSENKVPAAPPFIKDSSGLSWNETRTEFLSFQTNSAKATEKEVAEEEIQRTKDLLKGVSAKNPIFNDYETTNLGKKEDRIRDESPFSLDNSIKESSTDPKKKGKTKNIDSKESKLNYRSSKEGEKSKECQKTESESEKWHLDEESSVAHFKDDAGEAAPEKTAEESKGRHDVKGKEVNATEDRFNKEEIRDDVDNGGDPFQTTGMLINCESEESSCWKPRKEENKKDKNADSAKGNELQLEEFTLPKQVLAKSKRAFLKSLVSPKEEDSNTNAPKTFDLKKSATTQIFQEKSLDFASDCKSFNDAESLSSSAFQDFEIKPSLRQFLEEAKADMSKEIEEDSERKKEAFSANSLGDKEDLSSKKDLTALKDSVNKEALISKTITNEVVNKKGASKTGITDDNNSVDEVIKKDLVDKAIPACKEEPVGKNDMDTITEEEISTTETDLVNKATTNKEEEENLTSQNEENKVSKADENASKSDENLGANEKSKQFKKKSVSAPQEKSVLIDELLNAKNILKKPGKPKDVKIQTKKENVAVTETEPKKVWKRPPPPKTTAMMSSQPAEELSKACAALKRPVLAKTPGAKQTESSIKKKELQPKKDDSPTIKGKGQLPKQGQEPPKEEPKPQKDKFPSKKNELQPKKDKCGPPKNEAPEDESQTKKIEEGLIGTSSPEKAEPSRQAPSASKDETSRIKTPTKLKGTDSEQQTLIKKKVTASSKSGGDASQPKIPSDKSSSSGELRTALSPSQSADSAYGSSPSTPQPRVTADREGKKGNKGKYENVDKEEKEKTNETGLDDTEICELCGTNCHKKCEKQMANLCGVNQKLLAEALSSVKKGSSTDGKDASFRILTTASASKSASSVSSTEGETTTTDDEETETETDSSEYDGPAIIRPPIQTRPKYKKYNLDDFNFIKVLGKGSFGKVMLAQQINTENYFAVKCLKKDVVLEDNDVDCCLIERKVLTLGTKHPYLCHLFCSFQTKSHLFFVMEYLTGGDLMFHIQHCGRFDEYRSCFYAAEIISGLKFLHGKGIIYRDLKLDNILLDYEGHIRIADFGMCKLQIYLDRYADTFCGTPDYMAPEVIKGLHYNQCVDWWSFGVLMYEMMVGKSPFKGCDEDHLFWLICNEEPFYPRFLSREAQNLLKQLLDKDATRRLGPPYSPNGEIQCHQFFKYIDWYKIDHKEMEAPYKPMLRHILDVQYFDRCFTKKNAALTPVDDSILETMDQTPFKDFSYTNPNITD